MVILGDNCFSVKHRNTENRFDRMRENSPDRPGVANRPSKRHTKYSPRVPVEYKATIGTLNHSVYFAFVLAWKCHRGSPSFVLLEACINFTTLQ